MKIPSEEYLEKVKDAAAMMSSKVSRLQLLHRRADILHDMLHDSGYRSATLSIKGPGMTDKGSSISLDTSDSADMFTLLEDKTLDEIAYLMREIGLEEESS